MHRFIERLARIMAILGGMVLVALVVLVSISVLGRGLNTFGHSDILTGLSQAAADALIATGVGPVTGDFELVEAGIAFAVFAFLPVCQFYGAHATVDVFTSHLPGRLNRAIVAFWEVVLAFVIILISWRLFAGLQDKYAYGETSFLLQFPIWWSYAASFVASVVAAVVSVYCAGCRVVEAASGRFILPRSDGADH